MYHRSLLAVLCALVAAADVVSNNTMYLRNVASMCVSMNARQLLQRFLGTAKGTGQLTLAAGQVPRGALWLLSAASHGPA